MEGKLRAVEEAMMSQKRIDSVQWGKAQYPKLIYDGVRVIESSVLWTGSFGVVWHVETGAGMEVVETALVGSCSSMVRTELTLSPRQ